MSSLTDFRPVASGSGAGLSSVYAEVTTGTTYVVDPEAGRDYNILVSSKDVVIDIATNPASFSQGTIVVDKPIVTDSYKLSSTFVNAEDYAFPVFGFRKDGIELEGNTINAFDLDLQVAKIAFSPDGDKLFVGTTEDIAQYNLTSGNEFDLSAVGAVADATYTFSSIYVGSAWSFNGDGTAIIYTESSGTSATVYSLALSTPYDLATAGTETTVTTFTKEHSSASFRELAFNNEGTLALLVETGKTIHTFVLGTPYDFSTVTSHVTNNIDTLDRGLRKPALLHGNWFGVYGSATYRNFSVFKIEDNGVIHKVLPILDWGTPYDTHRQYDLYNNGIALKRGVPDSNGIVKMYRVPTKTKYWYTQAGSNVYIDKVESVL